MKVLTMLIPCSPSPPVPGRWPGVYQAPPQGPGTASLPSSPPCSLGNPSGGKGCNEFLKSIW